MPETDLPLKIDGGMIAGAAEDLKKAPSKAAAAHKNPISL